MSELHENVLLGRIAVAIRLSMETLTMSRKERKRVTVMVGVTEQELTLVQAGELMRVGYRQSKRIWKR